MARFSVDLGDELDGTLTQLAQDKSTTKAEVIRRALIAYEALKKEEMAGNRVSITGMEKNEKQKILKDVILP